MNKLCLLPLCRGKSIRCCPQMPFPLHIPRCCYLWVNGLWKMEAETKIILCQSLEKLAVSAAHLRILCSPRLSTGFCHCHINLILCGISHPPPHSEQESSQISGPTHPKNSFLERGLDNKSLQVVPRLGFVSPECKEGSQTKLSLQGREWKG